ncbi:hypothetical protein REPUB_Repub05bG0157300 [Reevesia pubescens]
MPMAPLPTTSTTSPVFCPNQMIPKARLHADIVLFHDFCSDLAKIVPAIVVSVDYRLAPEHRLPATYDDAGEALHWIKITQEEWVRDYADLSNCYLMGSSAGSNIAYHVGLQVAGVVHELEPLKIKGLVLNYPLFGGIQRSALESRLINDPILPPIVSDVMWDLSLPIGVDLGFHSFRELGI